MNDEIGDLIYSPINDLLPVPIEQVESVTDTIWFLEQAVCFGLDGRLLEVNLGNGLILDMVGSTEGLAVLTPTFELLTVDGAWVEHCISKRCLTTIWHHKTSTGLLMTEGAVRFIDIKMVIGHSSKTE